MPNLLMLHDATELLGMLATLRTACAFTVFYIIWARSLLVFRMRQIARQNFAGLREHRAKGARVNGGDGKAAALTVATRLAHHRGENLRVEQVGFVEDDEARDAREIKFAEN